MKCLLSATAFLTLAVIAAIATDAIAARTLSDLCLAIAYGAGTVSLFMFIISLEYLT